MAQKVAMENHTPNLRRNIFLDTDRNPDAIRSEYLSLINIAQQEGTALAIGHPYPQTLTFLQETLPELEKYGVELVSVSTLIARKNYLEKLPTWLQSAPPHLIQWKQEITSVATRSRP